MLNRFRNIIYKYRLFFGLYLIALQLLIFLPFLKVNHKLSSANQAEFVALTAELKSPCAVDNKTNKFEQQGATKVVNLELLNQIDFLFVDLYLLPQYLEKQELRSDFEQFWILQLLSNQVGLRSPPSISLSAQII